ncbi:MAG: hypothetical protein ACC661_02255 [Verrucomicrobiales bacterium]
MPINFLSSDRAPQAGEDFEKRPGGTGTLLLWAILIILMLAMNAAVWTFSLLVFGYPEKPFNYRFLQRIDKLDAIETFPVLDAPEGKFFSPRQLYETYYAHSEEHLKALNGVLLRDYIRNYEEAGPVVYVRGTFRIFQVRELTPDDLFPEGIILRGIYRDYPQVIIEYVMPSTDVPAEHFKVGDDLGIDVKGASTFAAVIHIGKLPEYKYCFTLVPLVYGSYELPGGGAVELSPPQSLNISAPLPITDDAIGEMPETAALDAP